MKFRFVLSIAFALVAGAARAASTPQEKANEDAVAGFYAGLDEADAEGLQGSARRDFIQKLCDRYIAPGYIQHSAMGDGNGREALVQMLGGRVKMTPPSGQALAAGQKLPPSKVVALAADGNYVIRINARTSNGQTSLIWNMFRLENGQLAEHWDAISETARAPGAGGPPPGASLSGGPAPPPAGAPRG